MSLNQQLSAKTFGMRFISAAEVQYDTLFTGNVKRGLYRLKQALPVFLAIRDYQGVPHFLCFPNQTKQQQLHCQIQMSRLLTIT